MKSNRLTLLHKELDLLVRTGLGIEPIAPALARLLRELVGAEGCFIGWFNSSGAPEGFFHDSAPAAAEDLFLNNSSLFVGPDELNVFWLTRKNGPNVGNMMNPGKAFFMSNTYNLLFKACGHHHGLDLRVQVDGVTRVAIGLFRLQAQPFSDEDAHRLNAFSSALQLACVKTSSATALANRLNLTCDAAETGHLMVSPDGQQIALINEQAARLLRLAKLFDQGVHLVRHMTAPPGFIRQLCLQLTLGSTQTAQSHLDVVGGKLVLTACWMKSAASATVPANVLANENILVSVSYHPSAAIALVRTISALALSPLQSRIAMFAATGGSRIDCAAHHQISKEALKKHLREVYAASRSSDWHQLASLLNAQ